MNLETNIKYRANVDAKGNISIIAFGVPVTNYQSVNSIVQNQKIAEPRLVQHHVPQKRRGIFVESFTFVRNFTLVFTVLFVGLNFSSFQQIFHASVFYEEVAQEREALESVTERDVSDLLLGVPKLPTAGGSIDPAIPSIPTVAPPDNRIIIPRIGKNVPLVEATDHALLRGDFDTFEKDIQHALTFGAVHYPGTAAPGDIGNVFITGHSSNYPWVLSKYNAVFALLPQLEVGDEYSVFYNGELYRYRINEKYEVSPRDVTVLDQPHDRRTGTLMTCTPIGTTLKRLILRSEEIDPYTGEPYQVVESSTPVKVDWGGELVM